MNRTKSNELHHEALSHLVGGVNSPVRAFKSVHGNPIYFEKASGAHVTDVDGNLLVDFVQSWGPLIHGHSHPEIIAAVHEKMLNGTSFGAPHLGEIELAKRVKNRFAHMDKVRFVSSGTEAVMSAVRLARGYTGRDILVKFEGCYHGHVDALMVSSGSGLATFGIASSPGIPQDTVATTLICPLDDLEAVEYAFNEHGDNIAAVVIEPLPANNGLLIQRPEFLKGLRALCDQHGALLIFDEVISGFRFQEGSYGDMCGVTPDHGARKGDRRRVARRCIRGSKRNHGTALTARPGLSGRNPVRESTRHGRRRQDPRSPRRRGVRVHGATGCVVGGTTRGRA